MLRRNFLVSFFLWILSFVFGYKVGNASRPDSNDMIIEKDGLSNSEKITILDEHLKDIAANIRQFGARTDGSNATEAFIAARASSKYIFVPEGTFMIEELSLRDVVIFGNGILKWKDNSSTFMLELKGQCIVEGLTFDGNGSTQRQSNITAIKLTKAGQTTIRNNVFINFHDKVLASDVENSHNVQILNNRFAKCGMISGCDVVTVRSSNWIINGNFFSNIGNGHCIRLGLYKGDPTKYPVEQITIIGNQFNNTKHVGVTCEIYSRNILITGNTFDHLEQAIKCESEGNTVYDITISNNIIRNIKLKTSLNLSVNKVKFTGNRCTNLVGGPFFGNYFDCSNNEFYECGSSMSAVVEVSGGSTHGIVANNLIVNPRYRGIVITSGTITGNQIMNCPDQAIRVSNSGVIVNNNINEAVDGIVLVSTVKNTLVANNIILNISGKAITYSKNLSLKTVLIKDNISDKSEG